MELSKDCIVRKDSGHFRYLSRLSLEKLQPGDIIYKRDYQDLFKVTIRDFSHVKEIIEKDSKIDGLLNHSNCSLNVYAISYYTKLPTIEDFKSTGFKVVDFSGGIYRLRKGVLNISAILQNKINDYYWELYFYIPDKPLFTVEEYDYNKIFKVINEIEGHYKTNSLWNLVRTKLREYSVKIWNH